MRAGMGDAMFFSYLFPARGRKLDVTGFNKFPLGVFSYLFPARGRKLISLTKLINLIDDRSFFPIFSPQGDGNISPRVDWRSKTSPVFSYLFPARGRKHKIETLISADIPLSFFLSFPRKGTETVRYSATQAKRRLVFFLSFPRKGTETGIIRPIGFP